MAPPPGRNLKASDILPSSSAIVNSLSSLSGSTVKEHQDTVWIADPQSTSGFLAGFLTSNNGRTAKVRYAATGEERDVPLCNVFERNPPHLDGQNAEGVKDMSALNYLNEPCVLHNLSLRYNKDKIYTYSGPFLVAINPYKTLPIYSEADIQRHKGKRRDEVDPHIFAISDDAYRSMLENKQNQSMLITGESGAGKTETTKKIIQYLAAIAGKSSSRSPLSQQLLDLNPLLEAFGNAKTLKNNNSSRFGKFIKLEFSNAGIIVGASMETYLLEKSRVCRQSGGERNFHIFYQLLAGANPTEKAEYRLADMASYKYLNRSKCYAIQGVDDAAEFLHMKKAMSSCGIDEEQQRNIFCILSAILSLGNIRFGVDGEHDQEEAALMGQQDINALTTAAALLGVDKKVLEAALINPKINAGAETVSKHLTAHQASENRDALCKSLYQRVFNKLVFEINNSLGSGENSDKFIGLLDISGFEIFDSNSFEQLCINYTNEKLQQFFNSHMFKLEQDEYMRERIQWEEQDFGLNSQPAIDLIEKRPDGILISLDEQCVFPKATDQTLLTKLNTHHSKHERYAIPRLKKDSFSIKHYAGQVEYNINSWLIKNKDPLELDIKICLSESSRKYVADLFAGDAEAVDEPIQFYPNAGSNDAPQSRSRSPSPSPRSRRKAACFVTVGAQHRDQLKGLMDILKATNPHFVRCIIPNHKQRPGNLEADIVVDQLKCNGVLEGIKIARIGYPGRWKYLDFLRKFGVIVGRNSRQGSNDPREETETILKDPRFALKSDMYQCGVTKIFFRAGVVANLEKILDHTIAKMMVSVQAACRGYLARKKMDTKIRKRSPEELQKAASVIQQSARFALNASNRATNDGKNLNWSKILHLAVPNLQKLKTLQAIEKSNLLSRTVESQKSQLKHYEHEVAEKEQKINKLVSELEVQGQLNVKLSEQNQSQESAIKKTIQERLKIEEDLKDEILRRQDLELRNQQMENRAKELEERLESESKNKKRLEEESKKQKDSINELQNHLSQLKNSNNRNESELQHTQALLDKETARLCGLESELACSQSNLANLNEEKRQMNQQISQLNDKLKKVETNRRDLDLQKQEQEEELEHARREIDRISKERESIESVLQTLKDQHALLLSEKNDYTSALTKLREDHRNTLRELENTNDTLARLQSQHDLLSNDRDEIAALLNKQKDEMKKQQRDREEKEAQAGRERKAAEEELKRQINQMKEERNIKQKQWAAMEEEWKAKVAAAFRDGEKANTREKEFNRQLSKATAEIANLSSRLEDALRSEEDSRSKLQQAIRRIDEETALHQSAARDVEDLKCRFAEQELEKQNLSRTLQAVETERDAVAERYKTCMTENSNMRDQLEKANGETYVLERVLKKQDAERDRLETEIVQWRNVAEESRSEVASLTRDLGEMKRKLQNTEEEKTAITNVARRDLEKMAISVEAMRNAVEVAKRSTDEERRRRAIAEGEVEQMRVERKEMESILREYATRCDRASKTAEDLQIALQIMREKLRATEDALHKSETKVLAMQTESSMFMHKTAQFVQEADCKRRAAESEREGAIRARTVLLDGINDGAWSAHHGFSRTCFPTSHFDASPESSTNTDVRITRLEKELESIRYQFGSLGSSRKY